MYSCIYLVIHKQFKLFNVENNFNCLFFKVYELLIVENYKNWSENEVINFKEKSHLVSLFEITLM